MTAPTPELKPCPCCNSLAGVVENRGTQWMAFITCTNEACGLQTDVCCADTADEARAMAAAIWNRRADDERVGELVADMGQVNARYCDWYQDGRPQDAAGEYYDSVNILRAAIAKHKGGEDGKENKV